MAKGDETVKTKKLLFNLAREYGADKLVAVRASRQYRILVEPLDGGFRIHGFRFRQDKTSYD
jgi:hypothetical protein